MNRSFSYKVYLPTLCEYMEFKELSNHLYIDIIKTIANNDDVKLMELYEHAILELNIDKRYKSSEISKIDKFCILLNIYILCVSNVMELKHPGSTAGVGKLKIDLYDVLDQVTNFDFVYNDEVIINKHLSVNLGVPVELYMATAENIVISSIKQLNVAGKKFNFNEYTYEQRHQALDEISADVSTKIIDSMKVKNNEYQLSVLKYGDKPDQQIKINLYNNSMFELLKIIYNTSLEGQYYYRYFGSKHVGLSSEYIESITPAELQAYMKFYQREQDEIKKQRDKAMKKTGGTHLGTPIQ